METVLDAHHFGVIFTYSEISYNESGLFGYGYSKTDLNTEGDAVILYIKTCLTPDYCEVFCHHDSTIEIV